MIHGQWTLGVYCPSYQSVALILKIMSHFPKRTNKESKEWVMSSGNMDLNMVEWFTKPNLARWDSVWQMNEWMIRWIPLWPYLYEGHLKAPLKQFISCMEFQWNIYQSILCKIKKKTYNIPIHMNVVIRNYWSHFITFRFKSQPTNFKAYLPYTSPLA